MKLTGKNAEPGLQIQKIGHPEWGAYTLMIDAQGWKAVKEGHSPARLGESGYVFAISLDDASGWEIVPFSKVFGFVIEIDSKNFIMDKEDAYDMIFDTFPNADDIHMPVEFRDSFLITFKRDESKNITEDITEKSEAIQKMVTEAK